MYCPPGTDHGQAASPDVDGDFTDGAESFAAMLQNGDLFANMVNPARYSAGSRAHVAHTDLDTMEPADLGRHRNGGKVYFPNSFDADGN